MTWVSVGINVWVSARDELLFGVAVLGIFCFYVDNVKSGGELMGIVNLEK